MLRYNTVIKRDLLLLGLLLATTIYGFYSTSKQLTGGINKFFLIEGVLLVLLQIGLLVAANLQHKSVLFALRIGQILQVLGYAILMFVFGLITFVNIILIAIILSINLIQIVDHHQLPRKFNTQMYRQRLIDDSEAVQRPGNMESSVNYPDNTQLNERLAKQRELFIEASRKRLEERRKKEEEEERARIAAVNEIQ